MKGTASASNIPDPTAGRSVSSMTWPPGFARIRRRSRPTTTCSPRWLARVSPAGLATVASRGRWILARHLALLDTYLVQVAARRITRLIVTMPPRHGKSELISKYLPAWWMGVHPDDPVMLVSYEARYAASWGMKARDVLAEWGPALYGVTVRADLAARDWWQLDGHAGVMYTAGIGGPIAGKGGRLIIVDDPIKNADEAHSPVVRARHWDWWQSTLYTRAEPDAVMIVVQTRWHADDLAGRLLADAEAGGDRWTVLTLPALAEPGDALGRSPGEALWPDRFSREQLHRIRAHLGAYWWSALYQQRPAPREGALIRRDWFRYYRRVESSVGEDAYVLGERQVAVRACQRFATIDLAASTAQTADYTVVGVFDATPAGDLLLCDLVRGRFEGPDQPALIRRVWARWRPAYFAIERTGYQLALMQTLVREGLPIRPAIGTDKDKVARALPAAVRYEMGQIYHPAQAPWLADYEEELLQFPNGAHDDMVDVTAYAVQELVARARPAIRSLHARNGEPDAIEAMMRRD